MVTHTPLLFDMTRNEVFEDHAKDHVVQQLRPMGMVTEMDFICTATYRCDAICDKNLYIAYDLHLHTFYYNRLVGRSVELQSHCGLSSSNCRL